MVCLFLIGSDRESAKVEASSNQFFDEFQEVSYPSAVLVRIGQQTPSSEDRITQNLNF